MINVNKKQAQVLEQALEEWQAEDLLTKEQNQQLRARIKVHTFDWGKLSKYAFLLAIVCILGAVAIGMGNSKALQWLFGVVGIEWGAVAMCTLLAIIFLFWGYRRKHTFPDNTFSNEALLAVGGIFLGAALGMVNFLRLLDNEVGAEYFYLFFLLATFIYVVLAIGLQSTALWIFALINSTLWASDVWVDGIEIGGDQLRSAYVAWGVLLLGLSLVLARIPRLQPFASSTSTTALVIILFHLWLLSFNLLFWRKEDTVWLRWLATGLLALASALALVTGIKKENNALKVLGIVFFLLNIYTKYIQFFWKQVDGFIFFTVLGLSFWVIGSRAEAIWKGKFLGGDKSS